MKNKNVNIIMRLVHRYLGFFLAGIMAIYALSGIVMIFRDTDFLKEETMVTKQIEPNTRGSEIGRMLGIKGFKIEKEEGNVVYFEGDHLRDGAVQKA